MLYVDLHSHVLWGIDDGARSLSVSLELLRLLHGLGFSEVYATPHQKHGAFVPTAAEIAERFHQVRDAAAEAGLALRLHVAAENFWDEVLLGRLRSGEQPTYRESPEAAQSQVFLFELPVLQMPPNLEGQLFQLRLRGWLPVLAHPERYSPLWGRMDKVAALARSAALVVDLGAIDGSQGPDRARAARQLLQDDLCHAVASDIHAAADARGVAGGIAWIKKKLGEKRLRALLCDGPRQIVAGELPDLAS